jgi:hypothetical protein
MNDMSEQNSNKRDDLWWDTLLLMTFHGILLLLLFLFVYAVVPVIGTLLGEIGASLPWSTRLLLDISWVVQQPLLGLAAALIFLWADVRIYRWFCVTHGKKSGTIYAVSVGGVIFVAILWIGILFGHSVTVIAEWHQTWRERIQAEQSTAPLLPAPQTGPEEDAR